MKKRRLLRLGLLAGLTLLGFWFVVWMTAPDYKIGQRTFDQIQIGMTEHEVTNIIGIAPGNYGGDPVDRETFLLRDKMHTLPVFAASQGYSCKEWFCNSGGIQICFDNEGKVVFDKFLGGIAGQFVPFQDDFGIKVKRWLGVRFRR